VRHNADVRALVDRVALLARIRKAFPVEPLPEITLRQAQLTDQGLAREITNEEWDAEGDKDRGVLWCDIPLDTLLECDAALSHLDEEAFVYYLPAFLSFALREGCPGNYREEELFGTTVFALTHLSNYNLSRFKRLTDEQINVVTDFVRWVHQAGGFHRPYAEKALKEYWETPDARRRTLIQAP
jgi:hypothetical protein